LRLSQSLADDDVVNWHFVVRKQLDLHNNVPALPQSGIGDRDFVKVITLGVIPNTATDKVTNMEWWAAQDNVN
jgi:hypothetical protein